MSSVLFVDDEPRVLEGLENLLWRQRRTWRLVFAEGGEAALRELAETPFDVVVTDMRMPGMDGATLLAHVQRLQPQTVRIVLSGYTELQAALQALPVAHQFLTKPASAQVVEQVVERACRLRNLVTDEHVRTLVGEVQALPCSPAVLAELRAVLECETATLSDVAGVVRRDVPISAKLLQLASSASFGGSQEPASIETALKRLGKKTLTQLAQSPEAFRPWEGDGIYGRVLHCCAAHARHVGAVSRRLLPEGSAAAGAAAGLLHDIGKLVLALQLPEQFEAASANARQSERPLHEVEHELLGMTHAEVGGYLLGVRGLPYPVVEAVANHHFPMRVPQLEFEALAAVHVADALVHEQAGPGEAWRPPFATYLASLGVAGQVPQWRAAAEAECREAA